MFWGNVVKYSRSMRLIFAVLSYTISCLIKFFFLFCIEISYCEKLERVFYDGD